MGIYSGWTGRTAFWGNDKLPVLVSKLAPRPLGRRFSTMDGRLERLILFYFGSRHVLKDVVPCDPEKIQIKE